MIAASKLPVADAMARIFGGGTVKAITALAVLNVAGLLNTLFLATRSCSLPWPGMAGSFGPPRS